MGKKMVVSEESGWLFDTGWQFFVVKCDETIFDLGRICHTISDGSEARPTNTLKKQYYVGSASSSFVVYMHDLAHGGTEVHGCSIKSSFIDAYNN